jgi:hypothetical protein
MNSRLFCNLYDYLIALLQGYEDIVGSDNIIVLQDESGNDPLHIYFVPSHDFAVAFTMLTKLSYTYLFDGPNHQTGIEYMIKKISSHTPDPKSEFPGIDSFNEHVPRMWFLTLNGISLEEDEPELFEGRENKTLLRAFVKKEFLEGIIAEFGKLRILLKKIQSYNVE